MYSLIFLGGASFILALVLTPLIRDLCLRFGLVDHPGDARRLHVAPIPRIGGLPLALACIGAFGLLLAFDSRGAGIVRESLPLVIRFLPGVAIIFATGVADDLIGLRPYQKLLGQIAAALASYSAGVSVHGFGGYDLGSVWTLPLTVAWLVLCTNAVNLIDGVDGLATGVGLFAASTTLIAALLQNNFPLAAATIALVGALAGFLRYNFNPATIFLGDSGSLLVGFLLGCYGVIWSQKSATILGMTAPLMALAIPLLDTALAVVRRFLGNKPIWQADRGHIHHRLLDRGLTTRKVVLLLYGMCSVAAMLSLALVSQRFEALVLLTFCGVAWVGIQHLGYVELGVAGRMFMEGAFRRHLSAQIALQTRQRQMEIATTPEQCWGILSGAAREFGFSRARAAIAGELFEFGDSRGLTRGFEVSVPLPKGDFIELTRSFHDTANLAIVAPFVEMLSRTLGPKLEGFREESAQATLRTVAAKVGG